jgi:hypothetical protein
MLLLIGSLPLCDEKIMVLDPNYLIRYVLERIGRKSSNPGTLPSVHLDRRFQLLECAEPCPAQPVNIPNKRSGWLSLQS